MFAVGIFLMTFGIALSCKADLGTSPISSVPWVMSMFLPFSLGDITIMMNIVMILAQPLILRALYVRELVGQLLTTLAFGCSIDFSMGLLDWFIPGSALEQWLACLLSIVVLALGVFLEVRAKIFLVAGEGVVSVLAFVTQKKFSLIKNCFDISLVTLAIIISWVEFGDLGKFVVAGKKVCAALLNHDFSATNIRVLIMNDDYSSLFHTKVVLQSDSTMHVTWGESEETLSPGTKLSVSPGDDRLKEGRMTITLEDPQKEIRILSTKRAQGTPSYFGSFELSEESDGLLLINELDVEDYLTRVVPSEMPSNYELEALKAQAVCARTYAYRQIKANAYSRYGAHVDDSTNYQVYNNTESSERTNLAVKETDGKIVYYNDTPAETYYFSTSCGYSTDGTIWGASKDEVPYLKGIGLTEKKKIPDLTDNDTFLKFIQGQGEQNYDSSFPMYRWKTTITNKKLQQKVDTIGEIQGIFVTSRGTGGIAQTVQIVGSEGTKTLKGQSQIRSVLGSESLVYKKNDGTELTGWSTLPSAFFSVDETARDEEKDIRTFTIWGGGYGHGVGMSQNGAQEMAREGKNYEEILMFFYDGVEIRDCEED